MSPEQRAILDRVREMRETGATNSDIARALGISNHEAARLERILDREEATT
jgi:hypothetical protein